MVKNYPQQTNNTVGAVKSDDEGKSQSEIRSDEIRVAEELAKDWLVDKKVVRFNLDKNEDINLTQQNAPSSRARESALLLQQDSLPRVPLSQKTASSKTAVSADIALNNAIADLSSQSTDQSGQVSATQMMSS